jgi:hypothetical protein
LRRFTECPDEGVFATATTDDQNFHPPLFSCCLRNSLCSFEASIVADEVKRLAYFTATEIDSARDRLRRAGLAELPTRT